MVTGQALKSTLLDPFHAKHVALIYMNLYYIHVDVMHQIKSSSTYHRCEKFKMRFSINNDGVTFTNDNI
jgi:hypothetical protein